MGPYSHSNGPRYTVRARVYTYGGFSQGVEHKLPTHFDERTRCTYSFCIFFSLNMDYITPLFLMEVTVMWFFDLLTCASMNHLTLEIAEDVVALSNTLINYNLCRVSA